MSAFLGKIHYWLYNKIQLHEKLIQEVTALANEKGYDSEQLLNESYSRYGFPVLGDLENEIEHSNIHGWLQERIISVESRLAYVITELLKGNITNNEEIAEIFYQSGTNAMKELGMNDGFPEDFYHSIFDYMLEGMPCDRINDITKNNEQMIEWQTVRDIHKDYWDRVGGDVSLSHNFRDAWISGFLSASSAGYQYARTENGINTIRRV